MRIGLYQMSQETDTFNPLPTTMDDFAAFGLETGAQMLERHRGPSTIGGYLAAVEASGRDVETVGLGHGLAVAGGRITTDALRFFEDRLRTELAAAGPLDGLAMHLHGACSAEGVDDVEGRLLAVARETAPGVPIVLTIDHHANVTGAMVDGCDALVGYRTQPHDPFDTAVASTNLLLRIVAGEVRATMAWRKIPLLSHQEQYLTAAGPMKTWFDRARALEREPGILSVSAFPMQPWLDVEEAGWAAVVVSDGDPARAEQAADELADLAWSLRADFQVKTSVSADEAVLDAEAADREAGKPLVILSDHGDSVFGGAAGDSTVLLEALLRLGVAGRALVPLIDPAAAASLADAELGTTLTVRVGGNVSGFFRPLEVTGTLRRRESRRLRLDDTPFGEFDLGPCAVLDLGTVTLLITSLRGVAGNHPGVYRAFGVEPSEFRMVVTKTASNFQWFMPLTTRVIRVNTPGPTTSEIADLPWQRVPRPIYPLDQRADWRP
jgi:microcystin degradation protein MlrC